MAMVSYEPLTNFTSIAEHAETWVEKQTPGTGTLVLPPRQAGGSRPRSTPRT